MNTNGTNGWQASAAGQQLNARLQDERTVEGLSHLLDRIDTLEQAVNRLATVMEQGPGMVSMVTDMVDEAYSEAATEGIDLEQRLKGLLQLAQKLTAPETVAKIDAALTMADRMPGMVSMVADMADEAYQRSADRGVYLEARMQSALQLAEKLTAPQMVENLESLITLSERAPGMVSMMADMVDDSYQQAADRGVDIEARLKTAVDLAEKLTAPDMSDRVDKLMGLMDQAPGLVAMFVDVLDEEIGKATEGILDPQALRVVAQAGHALAETQAAPPQKVGLWGMMRAMRDPEMKRTLGFAITFAKKFGQKMS